ncbi:MAG TPA: hypothetical protein PLC42_06385 [Parachlamydiaceae bacterium]|nr:hypothetical protein [Parachlamydiaceae bacterium]
MGITVHSFGPDFIPPDDPNKIPPKKIEEKELSKQKILPPIPETSTKQIKGISLAEDEKLKFADQLLQPLTEENEDRFITQVWNDGKGHVAREVVERIDTVDSLKKSASSELVYLKEKLAKEKNPEIAGQLQKRIGELQATLKKQNTVSSNWASSEFFRNILREHKVPAKSSVKEAVLAFEKAVEEHYLTSSLPVNMRYHTCDASIDGKGKTGSMSWLRLGAISDMSNGYLNLESLKQLQEQIQKDDLNLANSMRGQMARNIIENWKKHASNPQAVAGAGFALKQLGFSLKEIEEIGSSLKDRPYLYVNFKIDDRAKAEIQETIRKRQNFLATQFLQTVVENLKHASHEDLKEGTLKMIHVCLLNEKSQAIDRTGWNHDEKNEMYDMSAIFDQFDGKKLIADGKGPFVDEKGDIHLPPGIPHVEYGEGKELTLRSLFVNQCVQGSFSFLPTKDSPTLNAGDQRILNERARKKLKGMNVQNKELETIFRAEKTSFGNAAKMIEAANREGFKVSTGCLSAKDRTGFVSSLASDLVMKDFPKTSRVKFMRGQIKKTASAAKVIRENTGESYMKLTDFRLEGISKGKFHLKSFGVRMNVYVHQIAAIIRSFKP